MRRKVALIHKRHYRHRYIAIKGIGKALEDLHVALKQRLIVVHKAVILDILPITEDKDVGHLLILRDDIKCDGCSSGRDKLQLYGVLHAYALRNIDCRVGIYPRIDNLKAATALVGLVALGNIKLYNTCLRSIYVIYPVVLDIYLKFGPLGAIYEFVVKLEVSTLGRSLYLGGCKLKLWCRRSILDNGLVALTPRKECKSKSRTHH